MIVFILVTSVMVLLLLLIYVYNVLHSVERRRFNTCCMLDYLHGGSWYYDEKHDRYCDYMTDRTIPAKDVE